MTTQFSDYSTYVYRIKVKNLEALVELYPTLTKIVEDVGPDFIIFDQICSIPVGIDKGIKWANLFSFAMLVQFH